MKRKTLGRPGVLFFAAFLSLAMLLSLSVTVFAAPATVTSWTSPITR